MFLKKTDFTSQELEVIINTAIELISRGTFTGFNLIHCDNNILPNNKIIIHYLQDADEQIKNTEKDVHLMCPAVSTLLVPRFTFYRLDPKYTKKHNFRKEYANSMFLDSKLNQADMDSVLSHPDNKIVCNEEQDLLIYGISKKRIVDVTSNLLNIDKNGPLPWIHPAIIVKDDGLIKQIKGYVRKDYASIKKRNSEFYAVLYDKKSKSYLLAYVSRMCESLKDDSMQIKSGSLLISDSLINMDLDKYMKENLSKFSH